MSGEADKYSWSRDSPSKEQYGKDFALAIARKLIIKKEACVGSHRDYCGQGLIYDEKTGNFGICYVNDGYTDTPILSFKGTDEFVSWFSKQSDFTLGGFEEGNELYEKELFTRGNQRISKESLQTFLNEK